MENSTSVPTNLKSLLITISTLACSIVACERRFSLMNNIITDLLASLLISNASNLMFINANGPPIDRFQPKKYARSWLVNHRSATDAKPKPERDESASRHTWFVFSEK